jgi:hypothetical protein
MKRFIALMLLTLAVTGCATQRPNAGATAMADPSLSPELERAQITKMSDQETPLGWKILYGCVEAAGCVLANNPVIPYPDR